MRCRTDPEPLDLTPFPNECQRGPLAFTSSEFLNTRLEGNSETMARFALDAARQTL
jgi:hypothetical protein